MLDHALAYGAMGWPVFPCHPETKRPLLGNDRDDAGQAIPNSGGLKKASTDAALITRWWRKWPLAMIGVPTGAGCGLFVIDLDVPKDAVDPQNHIEELRAFIEKQSGESLARFRTSRTASGGQHIWCTMPDCDLGNRAGLLDKKRHPERAHMAGDIDVRGNGGYVIVPPSRRADGLDYAWDDDEGVMDMTGLQPPGDGLLDFVIKNRADPLLKAPPQNTPSLTTPIPSAHCDAQIERYGLAALDRETGELARCGKGGRNHALNLAAFSLGTLVGAGALGQSIVETALTDAAQACGLTKDDGPEQVTKTIASGLRGGMAKPRDLRSVMAQNQRTPPQGKGTAKAAQAAQQEAQKQRDADRQFVKTRSSRGQENRSTLAQDGHEERGGIAKAIVRHPATVGADDLTTYDLGPDAPDEGSISTTYSTATMNRDWALVLMGAKATVVHEQPHGPIEDRLRVLAVEAFNAWFANHFTQRTQPDGKVKAVTWAKAWMTSKTRRQYKGLVFLPDPLGDISKPEYLNLWQGFEYEPKEPGETCGYSVLKDHLLTNVCEGDRALAKWVFGWFAHMFQRPRERTGTALVFRGKMGAGKSIVGEVMGSLIGAHFFQVDDPRYITGQFNAHMAACLLLQAEEAVWAGDKAAEGRLKGLITSKYQMIEAKGIDPIRVQNFVRLMMTSNEDWVVPAGKDERRFCVLDVADNVAQNHGYFAEMFDELDNGGREELLHDLLTFDLDSVDLWTIPKTGGLLEQKIRSLDSVESWWFERLMHGEITRKAGQGDNPWPNEITKRDVFEDYIAQADTIGIKRKSEETVFGAKLQKLAPGLRSKRGSVMDQHGFYRRPWCYGVPALNEARDYFEGLLGQKVDWN